MAVGRSSLRVPAAGSDRRRTFSPLNRIVRFCRVKRASGAYRRKSRNGARAGLCPTRSGEAAPWASAVLTAADVRGSAGAPAGQRLVARSRGARDREAVGRSRIGLAPAGRGIRARRPDRAQRQRVQLVLFHFTSVAAGGARVSYARSAPLARPFVRLASRAGDGLGRQRVPQVSGGDGERPRISERISNGCGSAGRRQSSPGPVQGPAVQMAGHRSLSAETIRASPDAAAAASAARGTAMLTSSLLLVAGQVAPRTDGRLAVWPESGRG
jgi:hypothetical protein